MEYKPQNLIDRLKHETQLLHTRLENLPFFAALANGTLPLASYMNQLRAFATAFGTLEHAKTSLQEPAIRALLEVGESRFTHLLRDLGCFGDKMIPEIIGVKCHADAMAARIRLLGLEDPVALLGYVYVLQGTTLGNRVHLPDIQRICTVEKTGGDEFYTGYGDQTDEFWHVFASLMNSFGWGDETNERILTAAREAFCFLEDIHTALFPLPEADSMMFSATSINPEAGNHAVPSDKRELVAALTAGRLCREEFPYFEARYGDRGNRFTDSDAAWLATLAQLTPPLIISQTAWLGGVLASRGMPRITLERQLIYLYEELVKAVPDKQSDYSRLMEAVLWLKNERLRHISAETFDTLCHAFAAMTDGESGGRMKGTGLIIVSAVSDEKAGIAAAVASIESWLTDVERFSAKWCTAVRETIAQARSVAV